MQFPIDSILISASPGNFEGIRKLLSESTNKISFQSFPSDPNFPKDAISRLALLSSPNEKVCYVSESSILKVNNQTYFDEEFFHDIPLNWAKENNEKHATIDMSLAYSFDKKDIKILNGNLEGKIIFIEKNNIKESYQLNELFVPSHFDRNLSEMEKFRFSLDGRYEPYLELAETIRNHKYHGTFETHITVDISKNQLEFDQCKEKFEEICKLDTVKCKPVLIELPVGDHPTQLMTSSYQVGNFKEILKNSFLISKQFSSNGFDISRIKIEVMFNSSGVPDTDEEAKALSPFNYFEFHVKLELKNPILPETLEQLTSICKLHRGHLSKNANKIENHIIHRFITQRLYHIGRESASQILKNCTTELKKSGFKIIGKQREYSIYDSNVSLDKGWI